MKRQIEIMLQHKAKGNEYAYHTLYQAMCRIYGAAKVNKAITKQG